VETVSKIPMKFAMMEILTRLMVVTQLATLNKDLTVILISQLHVLQFVKMALLLDLKNAMTTIQIQTMAVPYVKLIKTIFAQANLLNASHAKMESLKDPNNVMTEG